MYWEHQEATTCHCWSTTYCGVVFAAMSSCKGKTARHVCSATQVNHDLQMQQLANGTARPNKLLNVDCAAEAALEAQEPTVHLLREVYIAITWCWSCLQTRQLAMMSCIG